MGPFSAPLPAFFVAPSSGPTETVAINSLLPADTNVCLDFSCGEDPCVETEMVTAQPFVGVLPFPFPPPPPIHVGIAP